MLFFRSQDLDQDAGTYQPCGRSLGINFVHLLDCKLPQLLRIRSLIAPSLQGDRIPELHDVMAWMSASQVEIPSPAIDPGTHQSSKNSAGPLMSSNKQ